MQTLQYYMYSTVRVEYLSILQCDFKVNSCKTFSFYIYVIGISLFSQMETLSKRSRSCGWEWTDCPGMDRMHPVAESARLCQTPRGCFVATRQATATGGSFTARTQSQCCKLVETGRASPAASVREKALKTWIRCRFKTRVAMRILNMGPFCGLKFCLRWKAR